MLDVLDNEKGRVLEPGLYFNIIAAWAIAIGLLFS